MNQMILCTRADAIGYVSGRQVDLNVSRGHLGQLQRISKACTDIVLEISISNNNNDNS